MVGWPRGGWPRGGWPRVGMHYVYCGGPLREIATCWEGWRCGEVATWKSGQVEGRSPGGGDYVER